MPNWCSSGQFDVLIIGTGTAGYNVAEGCVRGKKTAIVDRLPYGGDASGWAASKRIGQKYATYKLIIDEAKIKL